MRIAFVVAVALTDLVAAQAAVAQTDTTPPSVSITSPAPGGAVTGTVNVTADATDDTGVAGVQFLLDGNPLGVEKTLAPYSISWNTHGSSDLVFGAVKVKLAGMTISAGNGFTRRLAVSCSGCTGADTVSIDSIRTTSGAASAAFTFSAATHYAAHMAAFKAATTPVYVQGASATSNSGSSSINKAFGANVAAGHLLVVAVAWSGSSPVSVTDNRSNVYAAATSAYDATLGQSLAIFYAPNAAAGATTVTARFTGASPAARRLEIHEYAGMAAANPLDATAMNSADGTTLVSSITTGAMPTTVCPAAANGIHTLTAVARDLAGNSTTSAPVTFTVGADTTAPVISNVTVSSITASGATITWTTDEPADSQVDYGVTTAYGSTTALNGTRVTAHAVNLTGLVGPALYHVRVRSTDAAGNLALSGDVTFNTPDGTPPTVSLTAPAATTVSGAVIVSANAADNVGVAGVQFRLDGANLGVEITAAPYSLSWNTATSANGSHTVTAVARDAAGNQAVSAPVTVSVSNDATPPTVSMTAPAEGATVSGTATLAAAASDDVGVAGVQFAVDGANLGAEITTAPYSAVWDTSAAANGAHTLTAIARDAAGNRTTSAGVTVTVNNDTTPPVLSGVVITNVGASTATIGWTTDEAADSQVEFGLTTGYGSLSALDTSLVITHSVSLSGLAGGTLYHVRVRSHDAAGNLAVSADTTLTTGDATPPTVAITAPSAGATISGTATITATATDNVGVAGVLFSLDGVAFGPEITTPPYTASWNTQGTADLIFGAVKVGVGGMTIGAGTGTTRRLGVSCPTCTGDDTVSADAVQTLPGPAAAVFTFSAAAHYLADAAAFKATTTPMYLQGAAATSNTAAATISQTFAAPVSAGSLIIAAVAWSGTDPVAVTDTLGNTYAVAVTNYDATLNQTLAIVYAAGVSGGATTVTASFGSTSPAAQRLEIHEYAGIATTNPLDATAMNSADGTTDADAVTSGPLATTVVAAAANGSHTLTAVARDAAGNSTTSSSVTVNVLNDSVPPVVSLSSPADGAMLSGTVTVSANATDDTAVAGVQFTLDGVAFGAEQAAAPYSISWNTATAGNASHTLAAIARDAAGNRTTSAAVHVTVNNDTTPPVISAVVVSSLTSSGATIAWTTDEAADSEVEYGLTTAYGSFSTLDVTPVTSHTLAISTLASATTYHFRVRSRDAAGNLAVSNDFSLTTVDGIAPTVALTSPAAGSTVSATVTITATASDNIGVAGVQFQLDGMPIGAEDTSAPYSIAWDTTVVTAGPHTLTAVARDTSGNRTTSAQVNVTVANSGQVTLAWDASVDPTLSGYKVYVGTASGVYATSVVDVGNLTTATLTGLQSGTVYYFALTSYNQNGDEGGFSNEVNATVP